MNNVKKTLNTLILGGVVALYIASTPSKDSINPTSMNYILPKEIVVTETTLPKHERTKKDGSLEYYVTSSDIAKYDKFSIQTNRYTVEKDEDWAPTRAIGHVVSLVNKFMFWDWNISRGVDKEKTNAFIAMLEQNKELKDITVRLGYNATCKDLYRLFADDKVTERNGFLARLLIGLPTTVIGDIMAELGRADYYNSMTQTAMIYSNIESIGAHEIGHHKDFQRYDRDWLYQLLRPLPPVMLVQEGKASFYAKDIMVKEDAWQFNRYLIPAFAFYVLSIINKTGKKSNDTNSTSTSLNRSSYYRRKLEDKMGYKSGTWRK